MRECLDGRGIFTNGEGGIWASSTSWVMGRDKMISEQISAKVDWSHLLKDLETMRSKG